MSKQVTVIVTKQRGEKANVSFYGKNGEKVSAEKVRRAPRKEKLTYEMAR